MNYSYNIASEKNMLKLGQALANACMNFAVSKCVIYLQGELGAGKTTLTRGFLRALGFAQSVKSPSYTIVEPYVVNNLQVYHFDLYRLSHPEELMYIGARDYFSERAICLIEWPEHGNGFIPEADIICSLFMDEYSSKKRLVTVVDNSIIGGSIAQNIMEVW